MLVSVDSGVFSRSTGERGCVAPVLREVRTQGNPSSGRKGATHQKDGDSEACRGRMTFPRSLSQFVDLEANQVSKTRVHRLAAALLHPGVKTGLMLC